MTKLSNGLLQIEMSDLPIKLTPAMGFYAAKLGYEPDDCKMEMEIKKVKILEKNFLSIEYADNIVHIEQERDEDGNLINIESLVHSQPIRTDIRMVIHNDLRNAFKALTVHVLFINGLVSDDKYNSLQEMNFESMGLENEFEAFWTEWEQRQASEHEYRMMSRVNVLGLSFSGAGDSESVSIVSTIKNPYGKETANVTALVKINDIEEKYYFAKDLKIAVENLKSEIRQFIYFGKVGEISKQLDLFNEEQD